jgi:hypothetical protein
MELVFLVKNRGASGMSCKLTLRISAEGDLAAASSATNMESVDWNRKVPLVQGLLARVELATLRNELAAVSTLHREGCHETARGELRLSFAILTRALGRARDCRGIEIRGVILR